MAAMGGRKPTGTVVEKMTRRGRVFAIRFRAYGDRQYETIGYEHDGWTRELVEEELERRLAEVKLGQYIPPRDAKAEVVVVEPEDALTFREYAWTWLGRIRGEVRGSTYEVYEWHVKLLLPHLGECPLPELDVEAADDAKRAMVNANPHLSAATVNKVLVRLGQIMDEAVEYKHAPFNPMRINPRKRKLKQNPKQRPYLDRAQQIAALLLAAQELDAEAKRYRHIGRYALTCVLVLGGLRIGEVLALRWRDVDLQGERLRVMGGGDGKTRAATRRVKLRPRLWKALNDHKHRSPNTGPDDLVFATTNGTRMGKDNVRNRLVVKARERADAIMEKQGGVPLPKVTPHGLRHTFASCLHALGVPKANVKQEGGWDDSRTLEDIYTHPFEPEEVERMRALIDGTMSLTELLAGKGLGTGDAVVPETPRIEPNPIPSS